jgi:hypothetical protein
MDQPVFGNSRALGLCAVCLGRRCCALRFGPLLPNEVPAPMTPLASAQDASDSIEQTSAEFLPT